MSRSRKKTPIHGIACCRSEKADKKIWHRRFRASERSRLVDVLRCPEIADGYLTTHFREVSNRWSMGKDGKVHWEKPDSSDDYFDIWLKCCVRK
jgi:hypothetical protein